MNLYHRLRMGLETQAAKPLSDHISYRQAHKRILTFRGKASQYVCTRCPQIAQHWALQHGSPEEVTGTRLGQRRPAYWSPNPFDYDPMCQKHHAEYDRADRADRKAEQAADVADLDAWLDEMMPPEADR